MSEPAFDLLTADTKLLQTLLQRGEVTSSVLIDVYLAQIAKYDEYLNAMIQVRSTPLLKSVAEALDLERQEGRLRGPLHGIPIINKDNIATHPDLGMRTTAGSLALYDSKPPRNAKIVDMLIEAGAIILGKANLSELSNYKGVNMPSGWSAVGGQTQSAYVRGGLQPNDTHVGHSNPGGSSTGSAVAVSAGYAPISIGTETDGSLICPAGRAALYTVKPTIGLVPQAGIVPVSRTFDSAGPMTKIVHDLAILLDAISDSNDSASFTTQLKGSWDGIGVATLDPDIWKPSYDIKPIPEATKQIVKTIREAYQTIKPLVKKFAEDVDLMLPDNIMLEGEDSKVTITRIDFKHDINQYLQDLDESAVRSLSKLITFNSEHAEQELPPHHNNQDRLIAAERQSITDDQYQAHINNMRRFRDEGVDHILRKHNVDVIIGPSDSELHSIAAYTGYPIAQAPLGYLDDNGRPFGVSIIAKAGQDALLVRVLSAWEATFPARKAPPMLVE